MGQVIMLEDLRVVADEPRVVDMRLAEALGFSHKPEIRRLIKRNEEELSRQGEVCVMAPQTSPEGGRPGLEYWLNEAQALLVTMFARTPLAAEARAQMIRVFMEWRRQHARSPALEPLPQYGSDAAVAVLRERRELIKEARLLFGEARAAKLWATIGLPPVPEDIPAIGVSSGPRCLAHLLAAELTRDKTIGLAIEDGLNFETFGDATTLETIGVRIVDDEPRGVMVANGHMHLAKIFAGTPWARGRWSNALKGLAGAKPAGPQRYAGDTHRGVFIPERTVLSALESE